MTEESTHSTRSGTARGSERRARSEAQRARCSSATCSSSSWWRVLISFLIKTFLIRSFYIPSESMEQTLQMNDRIIVNQLVPERRCRSSAATSSSSRIRADG